jgi:hypothetical protein
MAIDTGFHGRRMIQFHYIAHCYVAMACPALHFGIAMLCVTEEYEVRKLVQLLRGNVVEHFAG